MRQVIPTFFLFQLAEFEGIAIEWHRFNHMDALYMYTPSIPKPVIALSKTLQTQERKLRCVLAHELGHHFETAGHHIIAANSTSSVYATKNELLATKWAVNLLVPTDVFIQRIKDGMDGQQLADYFHVTDDFIKFKSELIKVDERQSDIASELRASYNVVF